MTHTVQSSNEPKSKRTAKRTARSKAEPRASKWLYDRDAVTAADFPVAPAAMRRLNELNGSAVRVMDVPTYGEIKYRERMHPSVHRTCLFSKGVMAVVCRGCENLLAPYNVHAYTHDGQGWVCKICQLYATHVDVNSSFFVLQAMHRRDNGQYIKHRTDAPYRSWPIACPTALIPCTPPK